MQTVNFYKIVSTNTYKVYVGSTVKTLSERMSGHIYDYNQFQEYKQHYVSSFDILDFKDYSIQLIETKDCKDIDECRTIERYHILNTPTAINIYINQEEQKNNIDKTILNIINNINNNIVKTTKKILNNIIETMNKN
jgi:hypothetical protein